MTTDITEMIGGIIDQYSDPVIIVIVPQGAGDGDGLDTESEVEDASENSLVNDNWFSEGFWDQFYNASVTPVAGAGGGLGDAILMDNPLQS